MRKASLLLVAAITLAAPFEAKATLQCVTYAREVTGLNLKGDAWKWWEAADGIYHRGNAPREGAVLVFKRQGSMIHGHVAVVRKATSPRIVLVDHANWAPRRSGERGKVQEAVPVMDVSPNNDWTRVRVWYEPTNQFGDHVYKTTGFVYRPGKAAPVEHVSLRDEAPAVTEPAPAAAKPETKAEAKASPAAPAKVEAAATAPAPQPAPTAAPAKAEGPESGKFDAHSWAEQA